METYGWTGIALANIDTQPANMTLTAIDDSRGKVTEDRVQVGPGVKTAGMVEKVFRSDPNRARYSYLACDRGILSFSVSGSDDGQMPDGLPLLCEHIRQR